MTPRCGFGGKTNRLRPACPGEAKAEPESSLIVRVAGRVRAAIPGRWAGRLLALRALRPGTGGLRDDDDGRQGQLDVPHTIACRPDAMSAAADVSLREQLQSLIARLPEGDVAVGPLVDELGAQGMLLLVIVLTLVFLIPVSIPGVSTVFGAVIVLIGAARLMGRPLWLPAAVRRRSVPAGRLRGALDVGLAWVQRLERITRPGRFAAMSEGRGTGLFNDAALILGAVLLMAPFGFIPFSNTVPGVALMCLAIGLLQRDGLMVLLGHLMNVLTIVYFAVLIGGGGLAIRELASRFWPA